MRRIASFLVGLSLGAVLATRSAPVGAAHAIALHGEPKYARGFACFDHVNPAAPRGGRLRQAMSGSFDSVNPFISLGTWAPVMSTIDTLLVSSEEEASVAYGLLAREVLIADDGSHVDFELDPAARFHDGSRVTPADVVCTFDVLRSRGHPRYRMRYASVSRAEPRDGGGCGFFSRATTLAG